MQCRVGARWQKIVTQFVQTRSPNRNCGSVQKDDSFAYDVDATILSPLSICCGGMIHDDFLYDALLDSHAISFQHVIATLQPFSRCTCVPLLSLSFSHISTPLFYDVLPLSTKKEKKVFSSFLFVFNQFCESIFPRENAQGNTYHAKLGDYDCFLEAC